MIKKYKKVHMFCLLQDFYFGNRSATLLLDPIFSLKNWVADRDSFCACWDRHQKDTTFYSDAYPRPGSGSCSEF
jgi:hypothetical protein